MQKDIKEKKFKEKITPYFRKRCFFKDKMSGNIHIYAFDADIDDKGVRWILANCFFGSQESFEEELSNQLEISPDEVIMFGAGVHADFFAEDRPLNWVVKKEQAGIWGVVYYNPHTGVIYLCDEGSFEELPLNLSRLKIQILPDKNS